MLFYEEIVRVLRLSRQALSDLKQEVNSLFQSSNRALFEKAAKSKVDVLFLDLEDSSCSR